MASQMQSQTNHRRHPAGQGIVVRIGAQHAHGGQGAADECRYCRELGHHISRWNRQTRRKEVTCPKLLAKERRQRERVARRSHGAGGGARPTSLGAWVAKAEKSVGVETAGRRWARGVGRRYEAPKTATHNRFAALAGDADSAVQEGPAPAVVEAPVGVWGAARVAELLRGAHERAEKPFAAEAAAAAIAELLQRPVGVVPASPPKVVKKVSFAGDSDNLEKPPCTTKVFDAGEPATAISSDEEEAPVKKLIIGKNAWRPKARRAQPAVDTSACCPASRRCAERVVFTRKLLAQKEKALAELKEEGSWADCEEQEELEETVAQLKAQLANGCCLSRN